MSWIQKLYETYEQHDFTSTQGMHPWAISHMVKQEHIEVVIDSNGNFRSCRARKLEWHESSTLIPATESSAGKSGAKIAPHPLCEEVSYCAFDFPSGDAKKHQAYKEQLFQWCASEYAHPKAAAVLAYLEQNRLWADLNSEHIFPVAISNSKGQKTKIKDEKVFIRWRVEADGVPLSGTWEHAELIKKWTAFDRANNAQQEVRSTRLTRRHPDNLGICMVTGTSTRLAQNHSRFIRYSSDGAKLISSNDTSGFTFIGRFFDAAQACGVGFEITQKAHNALRWLIARQAYRNNDQVIVRGRYQASPSLILWAVHSIYFRRKMNPKHPPRHRKLLTKVMQVKPLARNWLNCWQVTMPN